jgi:hypothetical protein
MPTDSPYLFVAAMDIEAEKEALFNEVYDTEHCPRLREVPGVISVVRFQAQDFSMVIGGERRTVRVGNEPKYVALYELESPEVLSGDAWASAVDSGRWPEGVRPYTRNRRHTLLKRA